MDRKKIISSKGYLEQAILCILEQYKFEIPKDEYGVVADDISDEMVKIINELDNFDK